MRRERRAFIRGLGLSLGFAVLVVLGPQALAGFEETKSFTADQLEIRNLVGEIHIQGHDAPQFEVAVRVQGRDATAERVRIESAAGQHSVLKIQFPLDETRRFVYPALGTGKVSFTPDNDSRTSWLARLLGAAFGSNIEVSGKGTGLEIWADVVVKVPRGKTLNLVHGVGNIGALDAEATLHLSSHGGQVQVVRLTGDVNVDTGSGDVSVSRVSGHVLVDTGSGDVSVEDARGGLLVDTGSGDVRISRCEGDEIDVDTGSGDVEVDSVTGRRLTVDTGSGGVRAVGVSADSATIDTGSGAVKLELARMGTGHYDIDTGSGGIELKLPSNASAELVAVTGAGSIAFDLGPDSRVEHRERDEAAARLGAGAAKVALDTGSGPIRVSQAR